MNSSEVQTGGKNNVSLDFEDTYKEERRRRKEEGREGGGGEAEERKGTQSS